MGYRIDFRVGGGVLQATVHGRSAHVAAIAREIGEQARPRFYIFAEMAARRLGCDLRRFEDHESALIWLRSPK